MIWGVYHGLFLVLERTSFGRFMDRHALLGHAYTLLVVMLGWVFFRADSLPVALTFLKTMAGFAVPPTGEFAFVTLYSPKLGLALAAAVLGSLPLIPYLAKLKDAAQDKGSRLALVLADATDLALGLVLLPGIFLLCLMSLASGTHNPFIYFQF